VTKSRETFSKVLLYESGEYLLMNPRYLESVITGRKSSTIRDGVLVFPDNCELLLRFSRSAPPVKVRVTESRVKRFKDLSQKEIEADGFGTRDELLAELRQYYPLIMEESVITVVNFRTIPPKDPEQRRRRTVGKK